jgi:hypothetical protein
MYTKQLTMKAFYRISLFVISLLIVSCVQDDNGDFIDYQVAIPVTQSLTDFRASVSIEDPQPIQQPGKIYTYEDYIFVNDFFQGIHIIDNSNPENPVKLSYLKIPANQDIAVKDDILYADSGIDLVAFNISNITNITTVARLENVFPTYNELTPEGADFIDYSTFNADEDVIVGFTIETRREVFYDTAVVEASNDAGSGNTGQGGSLARFNITGDFLYAVDNFSLNVFDITNLDNPQDLGEEHVGWQIETIFSYEDYLYIGSTAGMFIYSLDTPSSPTYQSEISHIVGCDPVVVQGNFAYVTIRGGNLCGQDLSILEVINVEDKQNPFILEQYSLDQPYGLGVKDDLVFVCDQGVGLRVFNASQTPVLEQIQLFENATALDVIPQDDKLIMVSETSIFQYLYTEDGLTLLSEFNLL